MKTSFHHRQTARISRKFVIAAQDHQTTRHVQALVAGFTSASHLSTLLHSRRRVALTPLIRRRFEALARLLNFPVDEVFVTEESREESVSR
jgi:hypothetical protein